MKKELYTTLSTNKSLIFYDIMKYPIPKQWEYFVAQTKKTEIEEQKSDMFSWSHKSPLLEEYITYISKRQRLFKSLPFIKTIYLCNSMSFNSIHEDSDIDIFIVTARKALRRARFSSAVLFWILGIKRSFHNKKQKFCLSFYVTEDHQNLYNISLPKTDIYLAYRIAHLVPIYEETIGNAKIYSHNTRITSLLPNIQPRQNIYLDMSCVSWNTKFKKILEFFQKWRFWYMIEFAIKSIWLPIVIYKMKKLESKWEDIIVNNYMLKFYADKRKKIALLYKIRKDKFQTGKNKDNF